MPGPVVELEFSDADGTAYLKAVRHLYYGTSNGEMIFKRFRIIDDRLWNTLRTMSMEAGIGLLLCDPVVAKAMDGELHAPSCPYDWHKADIHFAARHPLEWAGTLAHILCENTYGGKRLTDAEAMALAQEHLALVHPSGTGYAAYSDDRWCGFFAGIAWDHTFIVFDQDRVVSLLVLTDTD